MRSLTAVGMRDGTWYGRLQHAEADPDLSVTHGGRDVPDWKLSALPESEDMWSLEVPVPRAALTDGVQTVLISDAADGTVLGQFSVRAGEEVDGALDAEVAFLRAELDLLKRAFRRHCVETE